MKVAAGLLVVLIYVPIWYYLLYQILVRVGATELMMFLFWIYLPVGILVQIINHFVKADK